MYIFFNNLANVPQFIQSLFQSSSQLPSNGTVSSFGIPWQVTIQVRNSAYGKLEYKPFCGGVILDHKTILTSAQCFFGNEDCCTPKNSGDENCKGKLFTDPPHCWPCRLPNIEYDCTGKHFAENYIKFAQNDEVFEVIAGVTHLFQDIQGNPNSKAQVFLIPNIL